LYHDYVSGRHPERAPDRHPLPLIVGVPDEENTALLLEDLASAVGRGIVDDDDLLLAVHRANPPQRLRDRLPLVIGRNDDRDNQINYPPPKRGITTPNRPYVARASIGAVSIKTPHRSRRSGNHRSQPVAKA